MWFEIIFNASLVEVSRSQSKLTIDTGLWLRLDISFFSLSLNKPLYPIRSYSKFSPVSKPVNWQLFDNDFEKVIQKAYPEISEIKENLQGAGALYAGLSGSGSTVFGVFDNLKTAELTREDFSHYQTFLTSPVFHS